MSSMFRLSETILFNMESGKLSKLNFSNLWRYVNLNIKHTKAFCISILSVSCGTDLNPSIQHELGHMFEFGNPPSRSSPWKNSYRDCVSCNYSNRSRCRREIHQLTPDGQKYHPPVRLTPRHSPVAHKEHPTATSARADKSYLGGSLQPIGGLHVVVSMDQLITKLWFQ